MGLIDDLADGPLALDTAVFIYFIEEHPRYLPVVEPIFRAVDAGELQAVTSAVTLLEVLVVPYRAHDTALAEAYEAHLTQSRGLRLVDLSLPLLRAAAQLRAGTSLRTPDALQLAAAVGAGAGALVTNDWRWPSAIGGVRVLQIDDYASGVI